MIYSDIPPHFLRSTKALHTSCSRRETSKIAQGEVRDSGRNPGKQAQKKRPPRRARNEFLL